MRVGFYLLFKQDVRSTRSISFACCLSSVCQEDDDDGDDGDGEDDDEDSLFLTALLAFTTFPHRDENEEREKAQSNRYQHVWTDQKRLPNPKARSLTQGEGEG